MQLLWTIFPFLLLFDGSNLVFAKPWKADERKAECPDLCPAADPNKLNVHIVPHSHDDVGWLKTVDQYYYGLKTDIQRAGVQYIIDSVVEALKQNPERKFVQVETAFFNMWWKKQTPEMHETVRDLVRNGQLEIIGGGWSMNDEAAVHYQSVIDQFTFGLRTINETLGQCARPKVGWQIDPFGHSREMASLFAQMGYDGLFFARLDWRDKTKRLREKSAELLWRGSPNNLGDKANLFTSVLFNHYSAPPGFCFDITCRDDPIVVDDTIPDYNYESKVGNFAEFIRDQAVRYMTNNIIITMGDDFNYGDALSYFKNLDLIVSGFKKFPQHHNNSEINVFYSTPSCYIKAVNEALAVNNLQLPEKTDDFFPYASDYHAYWSGYYTSRPTSKRYERQGNNLLQAAKQLGVYTQLVQNDSDITSLKEAMGIMQHHDAITGTEKQHVANDYAKILHEAFQKTINKTQINIKKLLNKSAEPMEITFTSCLLANVSYCPTSEKDTFLVAVYNPLGQNVSEYIKIPVNSSSFAITGPNNQEIPYQILPSFSNFDEISGTPIAKYSLVFKAENIGPNGIKMFYVSAVAEDKNKMLHADSIGEKTYFGTTAAGFTINDTTGLLESITIDNKTINVKQELMYYLGAKGDNSAFERRASGAYIFRPNPNDTDAKRFGQTIKTLVYRGDLVEEVHQEYSSWAKQVIRVYKDANYVEFDWLVGPIDLSDGNGKEVIARFSTEINSSDVFYTDANGREMLQRIRNFRPTYNYSNEEPTAGNYYPVTSKIVIKNPTDNLEFAVLNDRAQGGTSLNSGEVELMLHRRLTHDDAFGVGEALNEEEYGMGLVARGQLFVTFGRIIPESGKSSAATQRIVEKRKLLQPWIFLAETGSLSLQQIQDGYNFEFSGLQVDLPENVHLLTLENWNLHSNQVLIRLEHILEVGEDPTLSEAVTVNLKDAFTQFQVLDLQEMTLDGNQLLGTTKRLIINKAENSPREKPKATEITLKPMEIRTFVAAIQSK